MITIAKGILMLGTSSYSGKSVLVAALCRILADEGIKVAPFKAQNMSLNSWVTQNGREIGISQAVQAKAARVEPTPDMNPILLKPKGEGISQVILKGKPYADIAAGDYYKLADELLKEVKNSLRWLARRYEVILMEGAGGAAEINLYDRDIANLGVARLTRVPIILIGDIDRGGVFASLYGTIKLLPQDVRAQVKGMVINKFRGDKRLLEPGLRQLEGLTGIPVIGVIPYSDLNLPSEDSLSLEDKVTESSEVSKDTAIEIAVIKLPHISNFTDFEPLEREEGVRLRYVSLKEDIGNPDVVILPGTKNTVDDLLALKQTGMAEQITRFEGPIIGICGGFQMLGREIIDWGVESIRREKRAIKGLGLLDVVTRFEGYEKRTEQVKRTVIGGGPILARMAGEEVCGYEIHMGTTYGNHDQVFEGEGYLNEKGLIFGTYMHGLFWNENFRRALLDYLFERKGLARPTSLSSKNDRDPYNNWAKIVKENLDMDFIHDFLQIKGQ